MPRIPLVGRMPLWLIFVGLIVIQLAPLPAIRISRSYTTPRGCKVETLSVGPGMYTRTTSSCRGPKAVWQGEGIGGALGGALTIAAVITSAVAERRRGASCGQRWLAALIIGLSAGGLGWVVLGVGVSMTCRSAEGMCGLAMLVPGTIGLIAALIGLGVALVTRKHVSRLTRAVAYGAIPAMLAVIITSGVIEAILR